MRVATWWIGSLFLAVSLVSCARQQSAPVPVTPDTGQANAELPQPPASRLATSPAKDHSAQPLASRPEAGQAKEPLAERLAKDPIAVLQEGLGKYNQHVTSYTCTLYKQERLHPKGPMGPQQKMDCKFLENPFSVCTDTVENPIGAKRVLYIEGQRDNKMLVQPNGLGGVLGFLLVDPHGPQARADTLEFIDQFGFKRSAERMIRSCQTAREEGILTFKVLGPDTVGGREVVVCEAKIAEPRPTGRFEFPHVRISLDREWLLPIAVDTWDAGDIQRGHYRYEDVDFQANLSAKDFLPQANGMSAPKEAPVAKLSGK